MIVCRLINATTTNIRKVKLMTYLLTMGRLVNAVKNTALNEGTETINREIKKRSEVRTAVKYLLFLTVNHLHRYIYSVTLPGKKKTHSNSKFQKRAGNSQHNEKIVFK